MTNFEESEISQILPVSLKYLPEVKAISYAIGNAMGKLIQYSHLASVYAAIDILPEDILDLLATELRTQYYDSNMDIERKRDIIKKTLLWHDRAGTPSAVKELVEVIFGEGQITEWFEYGGNPYRFKIKTNALLTPNMSEEFSVIIRKVKNTRSHLEAIEIERRIDNEIICAVGQLGNYKPAAIIDGFQDEQESTLEEFAMAAGLSNFKPPAIIDGFRDNMDIASEMNALVSRFDSQKPAAIIDGFEDSQSVEGLIVSGTAQSHQIKQAAIIEGFEEKAEPISNEFYSGAGTVATYKNQVIKEE